LELIKPRALKQGDTIGVIAPAGAVEDKPLQAGIQALRDVGFKVELARGIAQRKRYFAGEQQMRAEELERFFVRDDIRAILCARGGFGSVQLLPLLRPEVIHGHPKIIVGYSDVSVLLNWLVQKCNLVTFHGPMVAMDLAEGLSGRAKEFFWGTLLGEMKSWRVQGIEALRRGVAEGELVGGCLSTLVTTLGTPYEVETKDKILFLEDIGERPYRIERMLTHLQMARKFDKIAGLICGTFTQCEVQGQPRISEIVEDLFSSAPYPVAMGFPAGHGDENLLLPLGVKVALDGTSGILSLLECPVA
jgi:muramoyltetrapeptide carboxypeptidase